MPQKLTFRSNLKGHKCLLPTKSRRKCMEEKSVSQSSTLQRRRAKNFALQIEEVHTILLIMVYFPLRNLLRLLVPNFSPTQTTSNFLLIGSIEFIWKLTLARMHSKTQWPEDTNWVQGSSVIIWTGF